MRSNTVQISLAMVIHAPAKVNLYLRVLNKRPDGYHSIETIFEKVALFDKIVLRSLKKDKIEIFCDNADVPTDKGSLIYRTAGLLKSKTGSRKGASIKIFKNIPIAAGLGGGSSDVACVLAGLNKLWKVSLSLPELARLGKTLGADVPFFLHDYSFAVGRERGDKITPLKWKAKLWHLIVFCGKKVLSKDIYGMYRKERDPFRAVKRSLLFRARTPEFEDIENVLKNDLEPFVVEKEQETALVKDFLKDAGVRHSLVSGSGPSVFAIFKRRKEAEEKKALIVRRFPIIKEKGWQIFIVPTL